MQKNKDSYQKNYKLIISFLALSSVSLLVGLILSFNFAKKSVESEFMSLKIDVLENTLESYNQFVQIKIPHISHYRGYLDSLSASKYITNMLNQYPFVNQIMFYDSEISNHPLRDGFQYLGLSIGIRTLYRFKRHISKDSIIVFKNDKQGNFTLSKNDDFNKLCFKFGSLLEQADISKPLSDDAIYKTFYHTSSNKISYMNIPNEQNLVAFKNLLLKEQVKSPLYEADILSFELNPFELKIKNTHPELYQFIHIRKSTYHKTNDENNLLHTSINMYGPFADYKLYFASEKNFIDKEVNNRFLPIALSVIFIYVILSIITYLLYRNLTINHKLFKLQYDFINNFTHEFKTPVAVIKIAGNNIKNAQNLSLEEKNHYGKILDEEADKLNDLMNKLLSFTQLESKSIQINYESIHLQKFIQDIIDGYQIKYPDYIIEFNNSFFENFSSDPILLSSIFSNLIENSYKYSYTNRKHLTITISKNKSNLHISFEDKGIGISKEHLPHVFKKFYRIQNKYNQQGSVGLGLAFCKEIVNFMNGTINVTSKLGKGSRFQIILPHTH